MTLKVAMILVGCVAVIGVVVVLLRRGVLGGAKAQDSASAGSAKQ